MITPLKQKAARIVIVEDDDALMDLLTIRLEVAGYDTFPARNGVEALLDAVARPFEDRPELERYTLPPQPEERVLQTFCGT